MSIRTFILAAAAVTSVALPAAAGAQQYGGYGYNGHATSYGGYDDRGYRGDGNGYYRDDRAHDRWERHRWQERRRYEAAQRRRWAWEHRHGQNDRREHRGYSY